MQESELKLDIRQTAPPNVWIAISADEMKIVAMGKTFGEVSDLCDATGQPRDVSIFKTPPFWGPTFFAAC